MTALTFISKIENGKTTCSAAIAKALRSFEGKWLSITIKERKRARSNSQNAFYHAVIIPHMMELLRDFGNDVDHDMTHEFCKAMFMPPSGIKKTKIGKITHEARSTTWISTVDFEEYLERVRVFAAENGYVLPFPNEY